jgi:hypothetical protein
MNSGRRVGPVAAMTANSASQTPSWMRNRSLGRNGLTGTIYRSLVARRSSRVDPVAEIAGRRATSGVCGTEVETGERLLPSRDRKGANRASAQSPSTANRTMGSPCSSMT